MAGRQQSPMSQQQGNLQGPYKDPKNAPQSSASGLDAVVNWFNSLGGGFGGLLNGAPPTGGPPGQHGVSGPPGSQTWQGPHSGAQPGSQGMGSGFARPEAGSAQGQNPRDGQGVSSSSAPKEKGPGNHDAWRSPNQDPRYSSNQRNSDQRYSPTQEARSSPQNEMRNLPSQDPRRSASRDARQGGNSDLYQSSGGQAGPSSSSRRQPSMSNGQQQAGVRFQQNEDPTASYPAYASNHGASSSSGSSAYPGRATRSGQYEVDKDDLLDQHVAYYLNKHPDVRRAHNIYRKVQGVYMLDGREIQVEWQHGTEPGDHGFLVAVDGPLRQPFADYMEMSEANAEYDTQGVHSKSALHSIPKEKRMSFHDQHKMYSRLEAMKVAKEQALVRERAADYVKEGREVPGDLMQKYKKTIQQKLDPGGRRRAQRPPQAPGTGQPSMPPGAGVPVAPQGAMPGAMNVNPQADAAAPMDRSGGYGHAAGQAPAPWQGYQPGCAPGSSSAMGQPGSNPQSNPGWVGPCPGRQPPPGQQPNYGVPAPPPGAQLSAQPPLPNGVGGWAAPGGAAAAGGQPYPPWWH